MCKCGLDMSVSSTLKNDLFRAFHVGVDLSKPTINIFAKYSLFIDHVQMCSRHVGDICLKNDVFCVFSSWHGFIQTNYKLICLQSIPNLSTTCKCGLDMSVSSTLKNHLFSVFHVGVDLSKPTINMFPKYS
jgi:hypothetical protein